MLKNLENYLVKLNSGNREDRLLYLSFLKDMYLFCYQFYYSSRRQEDLKDFKEHIDLMGNYLGDFKL